MSFPHFLDKQKYPSLIEPHDFVRYLSLHSKRPLKRPVYGAMFCYDRRLAQYIRNHHAVEVEEAFFGNIFYFKESQFAVIADFGIGAPAAVATMEVLIALGVKEFISIGTAGSLQPFVKTGELVVCERAIRDEGVSHHYSAPEKFAYPSQASTHCLKNILTECQESFHVGTTWTTDAPYRETKEEVEFYQREGVLVVEMEASSLFAVAAYRAVQICCLLSISDSLAHFRWQPNFFHERAESGLEKLFQVSLRYFQKNEKVVEASITDVACDRSPSFSCVRTPVS